MRRLNRRQTLAGLGSVSLGALLAACSDDDSPTASVETSEGNTSTAEPKGAASDLASRFDDAASCSRTAEVTEGPFYFDVDRIRSDIREDREGATYLRGAQVTNADGIVEFTTVYPSWYQGRTVHIHAKVHIDKQTALTTQLFFSDDFSARVFEAEPYSDAGRDSFNQNDSLYSEELELTLSEEDEGYLGLITLDVA